MNSQKMPGNGWTKNFSQKGQTIIGVTISSGISFLTIIDEFYCKYSHFLIFRESNFFLSAKMYRV